MKIFAIVEGKRLVYKFGPKATGWKPRPKDGGTPMTDPIYYRDSLRCRKCLKFQENKQALEVSLIRQENNV